MVLFPSLYQAAGWLLVTITLLAICALSYICAIMGEIRHFQPLARSSYEFFFSRSRLLLLLLCKVVEAMAAMPGNARFDKRVEVSSSEGDSERC